jgi:hypothetical protein
MFRLKPEVESWFSNISLKGALKSKWDLYYLCLMLGLGGGRSEPVTGDRTDMVDYFIEDYKKSQKLIISLFMCAELGKFGIQFSDRLMAKDILDRYLNPTNPSFLTNNAFQRMNEYSYGGFLLLVENLGKPNDQATFLMQYEDLLSRVANENTTWA